MDDDAGDGAPGRGRDLDPPLGHRQPVARAGGAVAEHGARSRGEDGGHQTALVGQPVVPHGVHAAVHADQPPTRHAVAHGAATKAERHELSQRDHPVLRPRKPTIAASSLIAMTKKHV